jgi:hypothetical protein
MLQCYQLSPLSHDGKLSLVFVLGATGMAHIYVLLCILMREVDAV